MQDSHRHQRGRQGSSRSVYAEPNTVNIKSTQIPCKGIAKYYFRDEQQRTAKLVIIKRLAKVPTTLQQYSTDH